MKSKVTARQTGSLFKGKTSEETFEEVFKLIKEPISKEEMITLVIEAKKKHQA